MEKLKFFLLSAMLMLTTAVWSQRYHDAKADQIWGNPKSVTLNSGGQATTATYTSDGKIHQPTMSNQLYNGNGYMTSCNVSMNGQTGKAVFYYNGKNQVSKQVLSVAGGSITSEFTYNTNGTVRSETTTMSGDGMTQSMTITYTYNSFDSKGSWTSRTGHCNGQSAVETRTIVYW